MSTSWWLEALKITEKIIWEKETRVKFNPGLSANRPSNNWAQATKIVKNRSRFQAQLLWICFREDKCLYPTPDQNQWLSNIISRYKFGFQTRRSEKQHTLARIIDNYNTHAYVVNTRVLKPGAEFFTVLLLYILG